MIENKTHSSQSRRDFFKYLMLTGAALSLPKINAFSGTSIDVADESAPEFEYKYSTFSVEHLKEVNTWFGNLRSEGKLSTNKTFQSYIGGFIFNPDAYMLGAKSVIVFAVPDKIQSIIFNHHGKKYTLLIPCGYSDNGLTGPMLRKRIKKDIIKDPSKKLKGRLRLPLKTLAVRSGLAEYGKNNIAYVNGYGSFHALYGLLTDKELDDNWGPLKMLRLCKGCSICIKECPTRCIRESNFVIDVGRCITLYNELPDAMPGWINPKAHNALAGCLKCQFDCPGNAEGIKHINRIAEMSEEETEFILKEGKDKEFHAKIIEKLNPFPPAQDLAYFSRNLKLALPNAKPE